MKKNNSRSETLAYLRGLLRRSRSLSELVVTRKVFIINYSDRPEDYFIRPENPERYETPEERAEVYGTEKLSRAEVEELESSGRFDITIIRVVYEKSSAHEGQQVEVVSFP